jgi:HD-like signal output (HDOD) protein
MNTVHAQQANADKTLELLWTRIRQRGDLPGFSKVVSTILSAMQADDDREFNMTKTVLSDPALTQRVLKLANSAMYSVFGQNINTVSKAVIVLGTEAIGHLALGLRLIDGLSSVSSESDNARDEMEKAVMAGHIARQVASHANTRDIEEAVVCSMLHSLGRMVTVFYLSEHWGQIQEAVAEGAAEEVAAHEVLGLSLDELGRMMAKRWGFPSSLINSMQNLPPKSMDEPLTHSDWLAAVSTMSTACADVICESGGEAKQDLSAIAGDYTQMLGLDTDQILGAINTAQETAKEEAVISKAERPATTRRTASATPAKSSKKEVREEISQLAKGVADMQGISNSANSGQMVTMALETLYKGLGLSHAIAFLRSPDQTRYLPRLCLGEGTQELIPHLVFNSAYQPDVFHASLANDKIIFVEQAQAPNFVSKLPRWWRDHFPATRSFIVLPLTLKRQSIGFLYGDWDQSLPEFKRETLEISALETLRSMVAQAIEERRKVEPNWMI